MGEVKTTEDQVNEFGKRHEDLLGELLSIQDPDVIGAAVLVWMAHLLQTIMLINFKRGGFLTNVEQAEIVDFIVQETQKRVYPLCLEQVQETYPGWFDKNNMRN